MAFAALYIPDETPSIPPDMVHHDIGGSHVSVNHDMGGSHVGSSHVWVNDDGGYNAEMVQSKIFEDPEMYMVD